MSVLSDDRASLPPVHFKRALTYGELLGGAEECVHQHGKHGGVEAVHRRNARQDSVTETWKGDQQETFFFGRHENATRSGAGKSISSPIGRIDIFLKHA